MLSYTESRLLNRYMFKFVGKCKQNSQ